MKESIMRVSVLALLCATCCTREAAAQPAPTAANEPKAFFFDPDLPESQQVYRVVVKFFDRHLGTAPAAPRGAR
jgi:hypothetical protein